MIMCVKWINWIKGRGSRYGASNLAVCHCQAQIQSPKRRFIWVLPPKIDYDQCKSGLLTQDAVSMQSCLKTPISESPWTKSRPGRWWSRSLSDWCWPLEPSHVDIRVWETQKPGLGRWCFLADLLDSHPRPHRILAIIACLKMNWL